MPKELWGTTAVLDHLRQRPYVAEALLFDRIVVPVPAPEEIDRWINSGRDPGRQRHLLDILGTGGGPEDLAVQIPWTQQHRERYEVLRATADLNAGSERLSLATDVEFDQEIIAAAKQYGEADPYYLTRLVLSDDASHERDREYYSRLPGVWVEAGRSYLHEHG